MVLLSHHPRLTRYLVRNKKRQQSMQGPNLVLAYANIVSSDVDAPQFKLDIRNEPIQEEDVDAQAALNNVANTLRVVSTATCYTEFHADTSSASTADSSNQEIRTHERTKGR